jgi:hypothetical protein
MQIHLLMASPRNSIDLGIIRKMVGHTMACSTPYGQVRILSKKGQGGWPTIGGNVSLVLTLVM